jgi:CRP/FNR family transcriptional regulator
LVARIAAIATDKALAAGQYLFHEGCSVQGMYVVGEGVIKVHRFNSFGREQVIHMYRPPESFAEESLLSVTGHPACASAVEDSRLLLIRRSEFLEILRQEPELALGVLRSMNRQLQILVRLLDDLTLKDVKTRFANWLLQQCPDPGSPLPICIRLPSTKRVLAAELGTVSETLSRTVAKFRAQKLLSVQGDLLTLHCPQRLTSLFPPAVFPLAATADGHLWGGLGEGPPRSRATPP